MKVTKVVVSFLFLILQLSVYAILGSVDKFDIQRRGDEINWNSDLFTVYFGSGGPHHDQCTNPVSNWCNTKNANYFSESNVGANGRYESCGCTCQFNFPTFLPQQQICVDKTGAQSFGGCTNYFHWPTEQDSDLLYRSIDLTVENPMAFKPNADYCYIVRGHYFDYSGFQIKWQRICDEIFSFNSSSGTMMFQWKADKAGNLSGRIIRLKVTCHSSSSNTTEIGCMLFKALGTVTYESSISVVAQSTCPTPPPPSSSLVSPLPLPSSTSLPPPASSPPSPGLASPSLPPPPPSSSSPRPSSTSLPAPNTSTGRPKNIISTGGPYTIQPSKSSIATKSTSSSATIDGPGNKNARADGANSGAVIGAAVGGAAVIGLLIVVIIVFCKRRKLWKDKGKEAKLEVKNPVYGSSDIPLNTTTGNQVTTPSEQDSQPTYQGLVINSGQRNGSALYSSPNDNYDNCTVYQSLDKKIPGSPVYQSLQKGQVATGQPKPSVTGLPNPSVIGRPNSSFTGSPSGGPNATAEPVYNVLEQPDTEQGTIPEDFYDNNGDTQDPLYNVLEGPDAEQTYAASDVGDPLYNVLEGPESRPESRQGPEEPLYNVLESSDAESNPSGTQGSHDGVKSEPLYNVLERPDLHGPNKGGVGYGAPNGPTSAGNRDNSEPMYNVLERPDSHGPNKGGVGYGAPNGPTSAGAHDNPVYEQSIELNAPYAAVHKPGSKKESVYEPLTGPQRQDLYMSISKGGKGGTSSHA